MDRHNEPNEKNELFMSSQIMMVVSYTLFSVILIAESMIMGWEMWAVILIAAGVAISWYMHINRIGSDNLRLWIVSLLMMATFFFYGSHETSTYDLAIVMSAVIFLYTMTGMYRLISLCQITYYITMAYEIASLVASGTRFDALLTTRTILHFAMVTMICWISRIIIDKWKAVLGHSKEEINMLTQATERLGDFLANISHEIRTPINAILGLCNMSLEAETDALKRERLESIEEAGKKIGEQISDILDFSEIDRNDLTNNLEDYMLSSILNDIVNELQPYMKREVELIIDVDSSIPSVMNTDVGKLKKILWHLITNGLKYTNEGGVYVHISSIQQEYGINLCIEVKDTGIGMDTGQLEMIYDKFYKADSGRARMTAGLGLGMPIVYGFVRSLGGFMTVESRPGEGTMVTVSIPNKVVDSDFCMSFANRESVSLGSYLHFEKFPNPNVREFYDRMVMNIVKGLKVTMHRVDNTESLRALTASKKLTHLFAGPEEYENAAEFMEELAKSIIVTVIANPEDLNIPPGSRVRVMPKPFYCFPVIGVLNSRPDDEVFDEGRLTFPGAKVLVVDDEPMNLIVSMGMFKGYGMDVTTCASGAEAIELCRENEYDIIFMDHMMPVMDGVEAMKRIRSDQNRNRKHVPVIAFTANAVSSAREMFRAEGFDGFVSKPVDRIELERVMRHVLPASLAVMVKPDEEAPQKTDERGAGTDGGKEPKTPEETQKIRGKVSVKDAGVQDGAHDDTMTGRLALAGVDIEKGLFYCQGDKEFYNTLLEQYLKESAAKKQIMSEALSNGDLAAYAIQVHSIKSTSKMIGAMELSEAARLLEEAAKKDDRAYIEEGHGEMMTKYESILNAIGGGGKEYPKPLAEDDIIEFEAAGNEPDGDEEGGTK